MQESLFMRIFGNRMRQRGKMWHFIIPAHAGFSSIRVSYGFGNILARLLKQGGASIWHLTPKQ